MPQPPQLPAQLPATPAPGFHFNPRTVGILAGLFIFICAVTILTDYLSPRKRTVEEPATTPATSRISQ
jgi:hypothetical protein